VAAPLPSKDVLGVPHKRRPFPRPPQESGAPQSGWMARRERGECHVLESRRSGGDGSLVGCGKEGCAPSEARFFDQPQMPPRPERCAKRDCATPGEGHLPPSRLIDSVTWGASRGAALLFPGTALIGANGRKSP
jgi:hypothetical protein